jgi:hypothetical protein
MEPMIAEKKMRKLADSWLTVQDAVNYCQSEGLSRTPKTIRKWAMRSHLLEPGAGDVVARSQDTENGFRWLIERSSLDVKIAQEIEFDSRKKAETFVPNLLEPVVTGADGAEEVHPQEQAIEQVETSTNPSEAVHTSASRRRLFNFSGEAIGSGASANRCERSTD